MQAKSENVRKIHDIHADGNCAKLRFKTKECAKTENTCIKSNENERTY